MMKWKRKNHGMTVVELLCGVLLFMVVATMCMTGYIAFQRYRKNVASLTRLEEVRGGTLELVNEDIRSAGAGLNSLAVVKSGGALLPAAYITEEGRVLTVIVTNQEGAGMVLPGSTKSSLVLFGTDFDKWRNLVSGNLVFINQPTGAAAPVLVQLTAAPRRATQADLPADSQYRINEDRATFLQIGDASECWEFQSAGDAWVPNSQAIPVNRVVRYFVGPDGLTRQEKSTCRQSLGPAANNGKSVPLAPFLESQLKFSYTTVTGTSTKLPADLNTLTGFQINLSINDPTTNQKTEDQTYAAFQGK